MRRRRAERKARQFPRGYLTEMFSTGNRGLVGSRWAGWGMGSKKWGEAGRFVTA